MASYSIKLLEKKYNNWVKAQLAVLFTKEGIEPFVCNKIQYFQLKCLNDICYSNGLLSGTSCASCCTENVVKCPTHGICNVRRGKCNYHRNSATKYLPSGCPNKICHHLKTEIENGHRFNGPSYKNTDATQWCCNPWEVAKCFMPPDGYKDVACAQETDFNGIISVIINYKDFQSRVHANLHSRNNIFEQAREIGRKVRHSSRLEVEDKDLQQYFRVFHLLLSDPGYLVTDTHAQHAKQKLTDMDNDTLVIGKDDIRKALDDVAKAAQDKIRTEISKQEKQYEEIRLDMITKKQEDLRSLESKTAEGVQILKATSLKVISTLRKKGSTERRNIDELVNRKRKNIKYETEAQVKRIKLRSDKSVKQIEEKTDEKAKTVKEDLVNLGETLRETLLKTSSKEDMYKDKQYIKHRNNLKVELMTLYKETQSTVPLSPLTDVWDTPLAGFYVMPEINQEISIFSERKETTRVESLNDLFKYGRKVPREIYLTADAGFGKTSFSKYLATLWCQAHFKDENYNCFKEEDLSTLSGFEFLFLVLLRDSSNVCHVDYMIEQLINENLPCSKSLPKNFVTEILSREKCLVILDGLDEWIHPENGCTKPIKTIPHRYARENCVILTTTRPWKLGDSNIKTSQIDKKLELVQLNDQSVFKLQLNALKEMKSGLSDNELDSQTRKLHNVMKDRSLNDLKAVPLILMYILGLLCDGKQIEDSKCQLYTSIIELLLTKQLKKYSNLETAFDPPQYKLPQCFNTHGNCQKYCTFIAGLGELAFYTLFSDQKENSLVFYRTVAEKYLKPEQLKFSFLSGTLTENKVKRYTEEMSKISFSHKTMQEYFAAVYICGQIKKNVEKIIIEKCRSLQDVLDMKILLVFISGMNPGLISSISHELMDVINNDETTCKYRSMTVYDYRYQYPLQDIQAMLISCMKECQQNKDLKLCLQDFFITEDCQQGNLFTKLKHLFHQNKDNIKSICIENKGVSSLKEIINLFALCDLQKIEKLYYIGDIEEEEMISILLMPLTCLTVISRKWVKDKFVKSLCHLSAKMIERLVKLQHLEYLYINNFTMSHQVMKTLFNFLQSKTSMKEITLYNLYCSDSKTSSECFKIDLSQHSNLRGLRFGSIPVSELKINVSSLEGCGVGDLYKPGLVSSYLSQLPKASKLQTFYCGHLELSSDIETMLEILPLLVHLKEIILSRNNFDEKPLKLSPAMVNIKCVQLWEIKMSCSVLHDLINVVSKLSHSVSIRLRGCDIKTEEDFEQLKTCIKTSDKFLVCSDGNHQYGQYEFMFKTTKNHLE